MTVDIQWLEPTACTDDDGWDELVQTAGLVGSWRRSALAAYARAGLRETHLAVARDGGAPVGVFCLIAGLSSIPARRYVRPSRPRGVRPMVCRLPFSFSPGYRFSPGLPAARRVEVLRLLAAATGARFGAAVPVLGFLAVPESEAALFAWCPLSVVLSPVAVVDVPGGGADEFLRAQPRRRRRRLAAAAEQAPLLTGGLFAEQHYRDPRALSDLEAATRLRHSSARRVMAPLPPRFLDALMQARAACVFGAEDVVDTAADLSATATPGARITMFDLLLPGEGEWLALATGSRDDLPHADVLAAALYLRELDAVAAAGARRLDLGPGSLATKLRMGARLAASNLHLAPLPWRPGWGGRRLPGRPRPPTVTSSTPAPRPDGLAHDC